MINPLSIAGLITTMEQIAFGMLLGVSMQLVFTIYSLVGEMISTHMARYNDPQNGVSSAPILYQLYYTMLVLLFFAVDGHLVIVSVAYQSFVFWPVGSGLHFTGFSSLVFALSWVFSAAVMIALPMVFCMTLVLFCFGLLNRISPTMNLFALGFPMAIITGWITILFTLNNMSDSYLLLTRQLLNKLGMVLQG